MKSLQKLPSFSVWRQAMRTCLQAAAKAVRAAPAPIQLLPCAGNVGWWLPPLQGGPRTASWPAVMPSLERAFPRRGQGASLPPPRLWRGAQGKVTLQILGGLRKGGNSLAHQPQLRSADGALRLLCFLVPARDSCDWTNAPPSELKGGGKSVLSLFWGGGRRVTGVPKKGSYSHANGSPAIFCMHCHTPQNR